jgi:hypothetical protein
MVKTKDGMLSILIKTMVHKLKALTKNSVCIATDYSTLYQSFHSTELLKCTETLTPTLRDGETMLLNNNSDSIALAKLLETTTGRIMLLTFKAMVTEPIS